MSTGRSQDDKSNGEHEFGNMVNKSGQIDLRFQPNRNWIRLYVKPGDKVEVLLPLQRAFNSSREHWSTSMSSKRAVEIVGQQTNERDMFEKVTFKYISLSYGARKEWLAFYSNATEDVSPVYVFEIRDVNHLREPDTKIEARGQLAIPILYHKLEEFEPSPRYKATMLAGTTLTIRLNARHVGRPFYGKDLHYDFPSCLHVHPQEWEENEPGLNWLALGKYSHGCKLDVLVSAPSKLKEGIYQLKIYVQDPNQEDSDDDEVVKPVVIVDVTVDQRYKDTEDGAKLKDSKDGAKLKHSEDGAKGKDSKDGAKGEDSKDGAKGEDSKDGEKDNDTKLANLSNGVLQVFMEALGADNIEDFNNLYVFFWKSLLAFRLVYQEKKDEDDPEFLPFKMQCKRLQRQREFWEMLPLSGGDGGGGSVLDMKEKNTTIKIEAGNSQKINIFMPGDMYCFPKHEFQELIKIEAVCAWTPDLQTKHLPEAFGSQIFKISVNEIMEAVNVKVGIYLARGEVRDDEEPVHTINLEVLEKKEGCYFMSDLKEMESGNETPDGNKTPDFFEKRGGSAGKKRRGGGSGSGGVDKKLRGKGL